MISVAVVFRVFRSKKGALVMIEPPGNARRGRVFEIDDRVLIAGEVIFTKQCPGAMQQAREFKFRLGVDSLAVETRKQSGGRGAVETLVVKEDLDFQIRCFLSPGGRALPDAKLLELPSLKSFVKEQKRSSRTPPIPPPPSLGIFGFPRPFPTAPPLPS